MTFLGSTVGRICDHLDTTAAFVTHNLGMLILDEADRLLDMGFEKKLRWIVTKLRDLKTQNAELDNFKQNLVEEEEPEDDENLEECIGYMGPGTMEHRKTLLRESPSTSIRTPSLKQTKVAEKSFQSVLVSATLTPSVERLAGFVLKKGAEWVDIKSRGEESQIFPHNVDVDGTEENGFALRGGLARTTSKVGLTIPKHLKQFYVEISLKTRLVTLLSIILEKGRQGKVSFYYDYIIIVGVFLR